MLIQTMNAWLVQLTGYQQARADRSHFSLARAHGGAREIAAPFKFVVCHVASDDVHHRWPIIDIITTLAYFTLP